MGTQRGIISGGRGGDSGEHVYVLIFSFAKFRFSAGTTFTTQIRVWKSFHHTQDLSLLKEVRGRRLRLDAHRAPSPFSPVPPPASPASPALDAGSGFFLPLI